MNDVNHTITLLRTLLELPDLELNDDGQAELLLAPEFAAHLTRIDDETLELSFRLPDLDYSTPEMMAAMLTANFLGSGTGCGRLALDPTKGEVIYCERWPVTEMGAEIVEKRFTEFAKAGAFWLSEGSITLVAQTRPR